MKILFFGSSEFAVSAFKKIHDNKDFDIVGVVCQSDKPAGRGKKIHMVPIKECACKLGYENFLFQPENLKDNKDFLNKIKALNADIGVVVSYGKLLPDELLKIPKYNLINIHPSLLPKYRGASPIESAIMNGDNKTGTSIMKVVSELDSGDILAQKELEILDDDDSASMQDKLASLSSDLLLNVLYEYKNNGVCNSKIQDNDKATFCGKIEKDNCKIDWSWPTEKIFNFVRALSLNYSAYTFYNGKMLKVYKIEKNIEFENQGKPGEIIGKVKNKGIIVKTGDGQVLITEMQPENSKRMTGQAFLCGIGQGCLNLLLG